ncbi:MocR-like pyridoxine biosynthesis transcription factor PdxR [Psychromonas sp. Urea-02u-13]|uniref:MocR-like pyridoxine biosynthesis transcription factor PdxR n=1 Tax=Psychromonas sp. Urea-02u-13 TaxID=2058326 RepID=UPI000C328C93|nr:PLP-dependent aminotransferase family protein [Psychromonas sp. Urea-02u-13]PKG37412.1 PLP-dependent aminotransferase family protein [Psychromonas sp. Urea-02u-13]
MKMLNLTLDNSNQKLYLKIAHAIRSAINNGNVVSTEKLPSTRSLAEQLSVNRHTVMAAYNELVAQGWVETQQRQGYRVAENLPIFSSTAANKQKETMTHQHQWRLVKANNSVTPAAASRYQFNFAGGNPDIDLFPFNEFKSFMNDALNRPDIHELNYGDNMGFGPFIKQVSTYLRRVRSINNKQIIVVNGTQEALYILSQVLIKHGDKVAVESLGYQPAWSAFENAGAQLIAVKQTDHGIDVDHLEQLIQAHTIRLLYLTPLHQYPTTTTLAMSKRQRIYQLAQQYNIAIIEDDYDHEFHYNSQPLAPMAANDPSGLVIYLSSFSKIMFPGIRLGIIAVDQSLCQHIVNYRAIINHKVNVPLQDALARWMQDGGFERHLRKATRRYQKRRQCMVELLNEFIDEGLNISFSIPAGGMALWVNIGGNAQHVAQLAKQQSIFLLAENAFHLDKNNDQDKYIRLGFAGQDEQKIRQGLLLLKSLLK